MLASIVELALPVDAVGGALAGQGEHVPGREHLGPIVGRVPHPDAPKRALPALGGATPEATAAAAASVDDELIRKLNMPISELDLSVRASNCLESANIHRVADLVQRDEQELLSVRSFGKTSLREVKRKLVDLGLELGMELPDELEAQATS